MSSYINPLEDGVSKRKVVFLLAWPSIIEQLLLTLVNYIDTAMVGSLGVDATAAVSINMNLVWLANGIIFGISTGFSVLAARSVGENDKTRTKNILHQSLIACLVLGIGMTLIAELVIVPNYAIKMGADFEIIDDSKAYLSIISFGILFQTLITIAGGVVRGLGNTKTPMIYNCVLNIINVFLNFILIYPTQERIIFGFSVNTFGMNMGIRGAALATLIASVVSGVLMVSLYYRDNNPFRIGIFDKLKVDKDIMREAIQIGIPVVFERVSINIGQIIGTSLVTKMGKVTLSAHQLAQTAESICYMPATGFGVSATVLVAQSLGAEKEELAKDYYKRCLQYNIAVMIVMASLMFIFAPQLMAIFIKDKSVISIGTTLLRIEAFIEPCLAINYVFTGMMKARGETLKTFYIAILGMWIVRVPLSLFAVKVLHLGINWIWIAMGLDWIARTIACFAIQRKNNY